MPKSKLSESEKRSRDVEISYNEREYQAVKKQANLAKKPLARFIREMSLGEDTIQIISRNDKSTAARVRKISDLVSQLYVHRKSMSNSNNLSSTQSNSNNLSEIEVDYLNELGAELRSLNTELLGYSDL